MNAPHAGSSSLIRLDGGRVVMRLDFKCYGKVVADIYQASVFFACTGQQGTTIPGKRLEHRNGILVAAMFRPHDGKNSQLRKRGNSSKNAAYFAILFTVQSVFCGKGKGNLNFRMFHSSFQWFIQIIMIVQDCWPQQALYFFPLPQGQSSLRPGFFSAMTGC